MTHKLDTEELKLFLLSYKDIETANLFAFYKQKDPHINPQTVNWRVYSLVQSGVLNRIGRGKFKLGNQQTYLPEITPKIKIIYSKVKKEFPFLSLCVWNTSMMNEFMHHQPGRFYFIIEI